MIRFHPDLTVAEAARAARMLGCYLQATTDGHVVITPNESRKAKPANDPRSNIVFLPLDNPADLDTPA